MDKTTPPDIQTLIKHSFDTLLEDVSQGKSERFLAYLAFSARFHRYSSDNKRLIFSQCPNALRVAGYRKWAQEGYQVAKGSKAIRIKAPRIKKEVNPNTFSEEKQIVGYLGVSVFDVSQLTEDKRPPSFFPEIYGDYDRLYEAIVTAVQGENIKVIETPRTYGAQGFSAIGAIALKEGLTSGNRCLTLLHEFAHELIHTEQVRKELSKQVKECHAEATCYIVASHFGIPAPYSRDYLLDWSTTVDTLRTEMSVVQNAASQIIAKIEAVIHPSDTEQDSSLSATQSET